jgi:all-trans-retinol dehydrogenase (NAD+)
MASGAFGAVTWAASEPLITGGLLYVLTRGPPQFRDRILAPFRDNLLAHNGVARVAALITALKVLTSLGVLKGINNGLNRLALNNWGYRRRGKEWKFGPKKEEVVVITGASSGFGYEMVKSFSKHARVVAIDINPLPEELEKCECNKPGFLGTVPVGWSRLTG